MRNSKVIIILFCFIFILTNGVFNEGDIFSQKLNNVSILKKTGTKNETVSTDSSMKEHYDISIGYWDIQNSFWASDEDELLKKIQTDFNITIKPVQVNWTNYKEKYQVMAASGQLPDISANEIVNTSLYDDWIQQRVIRPIPADLSKYSNVQHVMSLSDVEGLKVDGKYYMIPRVSFEDRDLYASNCSLLVRKDWMVKLGIKDPTNFNEFTAMLKAFALNDPDGNGKNDTAGLTLNTRQAFGKWIILNIYPQFNSYSWVKDGGQFVPSCAAKDFPKVLLKLRELYTEGALDKDFSIENAGDGLKKFAQGKAGALEYATSPSALLQLEKEWDKYNKGNKFTDSVKSLHVFPAEDGNLYHNTSTVFWSESYFSKNVSDGKMDRILKLYDYLLSNDGKMLTRLGLPGKDYKSEENKIIVTRPRDEKAGTYVDLTTIYPSISLFNSLASWGGSYEDFEINDINKANYPEDILKMSYDDINWNLKNTKPMPRPYEIFEISTSAKAQFNSVNIVDDVTRVVIGDEDPVKMWQTVLKEYESKGLNEAIKEVNEKASELGIN